MRLTSVVDAQGRRTRLDYPTTGTDAERLRVTRVTDPYGRYAQFAYDGSGRLARITDVIGIESAFTYGAGDFLTSLTTPYGTTSFTNGPGTGAQRWVEVTHPTGEKERVEYNAQNNPATSVPFSESVVPSGSSVPLINQYINGRNSFYWDRKAYA
ncbi:MAG: hypothetical protein NZ585_08245, partial [Chloracidobacterium sp.]|nr:hypothetical protein [Chloracidobacterium sp.]